MLRWIFSIVLVLLFTQKSELNAQVVDFRITGKIRVEQGVVEGAEVLLYQNGRLQNQASINRTGNFVFTLQTGTTYRLVFKKDDFYSKEVEIDTRIPDDNFNKNLTLSPYQLSIFLLKTVPGVQPNDQQVGKIVFNPVIGNFDVLRDEEKIDYQKLIVNAMKEAREQSVKYENQAQTQKRSKYQNLLNQAAVLQSQNNYREAMERYRDAVMVFPYEQLPRAKVDELYRLSAIEQLQKSFGAVSDANYQRYMIYGDAKMAERETKLAMITFEQMLQHKPNDTSVRSKYETAKNSVQELKSLGASELQQRQLLYSNRNNRYNQLLAVGDSLLQLEIFAQAVESYSLAAGQIDENSYALLIIKKVDEILYDDEKAQQLAREREEQEKKRIREAREKAYKDAVNEADRLFENRLYRDAIEYYELALTVKSWEMYPKNQIRKINDLLAALQLGGAEYNRLLREADALFNSEQFSEAKDVYLRAHELIPNETYALAQAKRIDEILNRLEKEQKITKLYQESIFKADSYLAEKKYTESIIAYQQAQGYKPAEKYPPEQIRKIRDLIARADESQRTQMQLQNDYDQAISQADKAFEEKMYASAKSFYQRALTIIPRQEYPQNQITRIDQILMAHTQQPITSSVRLDQIDFDNLEKVSQFDRDEAYKEAMQMGDSFFKTKEWGIARFYYRKALALKPNDTTAQNRINEVEIQIRGTNVNESLYAEMIKKGDEAFRSSDFSVAKFYYGKALEAKANDTYSSERLGVVNHMISTESQRASNRDYEQAMQKGNEALAQNNFSVARFFFRRALTIKPNDPMAVQKMNDLEKGSQQTQSTSDNQAYQRFIKQADEAYKNKQFAVSKNLYRQALSVMPNHNYPKQQIEKIDSITSR